MTVLQAIGPLLFWGVVIGAIAFLLYRYFRLEEEGAGRRVKAGRPPRTRAVGRPDATPGARPPAPAAWEAPPGPTPAASQEPRPAPGPAARPAPLVDSRQATELALAVLPQHAPYDHRVTLDALPFFASGQHTYALSLRTTQAWGWGVFGATRSGKGNFLQLIALSALRLGPEACQVWVLDPKTGLDYGFCLQLAHARLYADGIAADGGLATGYEAAVQEMQRRNAILQQAGARNIQEYHAAGNPPLPYILLIADEVGQLDAAPRTHLSRLAAMAAASGMMLFVSTQYPTADVLSSQVQSNVQNRLVFRLASPRYSEVALGLARGERSKYDPAALPGPGIAILRRQGQELLGRVPELTSPLRAQLIADLRLYWPRSGAAPSPDLPAGLAPAPTTAPPERREEEGDEGPPRGRWTDTHLLIAGWISADPGISTREIARRLTPGSDGGGKASVKTSKLRKEVEEVLGRAPVPAVPPVPPVPPVPAGADEGLSGAGHGAQGTGPANSEQEKGLHN